MLNGKYFLNGADMFVQYGFVPAEGCVNDFLRARTRREVFKNVWKERNGDQYDLSNLPRYEDRTINMPGFIWVLASDAFNQFKTKYNALKAAFHTVGTVSIRSAEADETVNVFYLSMPNFNKRTRLRGTDFILCEIEIQLQEVQDL